MKVSAFGVTGSHTLFEEDKTYSCGSCDNR